MDQRQRRLAFGEIVADVLAERAGVGHVVEHVVGDLERVAEIEAVVVQRFACRGVASRPSIAPSRVAAANSTAVLRSITRR